MSGDTHFDSILRKQPPADDSAAVRNGDGITGNQGAVQGLSCNQDIRVAFQVSVSNVSHLDSAAAGDAAPSQHALSNRDHAGRRDFGIVRDTTDPDVAAGTDMEAGHDVSFDANGSFTVDVANA